jgi:fumarate hydratase subunit beta
MISLNTSNASEWAKELRANDVILLSGVVYTARDAAHKKIMAMIEQGDELPFSLEGAVIYYAGPTPAKNGMPIGSCGPTTSSRMDPYAPKLHRLGLAATIGKGERNSAVKEALIESGSVYLCALGGAGALAAKCITSCRVIAFEELGCESVKRLELKDFPLYVAMDSVGGSIFH